MRGLCILVLPEARACLRYQSFNARAIYTLPSSRYRRMGGAEYSNAIRDRRLSAMVEAGTFLTLTYEGEPCVGLTFLDRIGTASSLWVAVVNCKTGKGSAVSFASISQGDWKVKH